MAAGRADAGTIGALLRALLACPSRSGLDSPQPTLQVVADWLQAQAVPCTWLRADDGRALALCGEVAGGRPGPLYLLDAPADTAPYGDPATWSQPPDRPTEVDGWLYGRGSADSKAGMAVFCHVLADLQASPELRAGLAGRVGFVFDAGEHDGSFAGIRAYLAACGDDRPAGVLIGYPGDDRLVTGARGFLRVRLGVAGQAAHTGSARRRGVNAIVRAGQLLARLTALPLPAATADFPLPAQLTPTAIDGGGSFAQVPDRCTVDLDLRLTPAFDADAARAAVTAVVAEFDAVGDAGFDAGFDATADAGLAATTLAWQPGWPAYRLDPGLPLVQALCECASAAFGRPLAPALAGPSNIGNYLATLGIPATAGLGVRYRNLHAADECIRLDTLVPTFHAYRNALIRLLR